MLHEILNTKAKGKPRIRNEFRSISRDVLVNLYAHGVPREKIAKERPQQPASQTTTHRMRRRRRIINAATQNQTAAAIDIQLEEAGRAAETQIQQTHSPVEEDRTDVDAKF
jgi:hypothetical protein